MEGVIRVLVVDDSAYVRKVIRQMLSRSPFIEVVGAARDGEEALQMVDQLEPDVVTLDLIMPGLGGLGFLKTQMQKKPVPTIVVSIANETSQTVLEALDLGAVDFVQKPSALANEKIFEMSEELISKVKAASTIPMGRTVAPARLAMASPRVAVAGQVDQIVIGLSTGGPQALKKFVPQLPADFPIPIAVVLHMPTGYTEMYAKSLNDMSALEVVEAREGELFSPGRLVIAQAGRHLLFQRSGSTVTAHLDARPFDTLHRPSVDVLFRSAAETFEERALGIIMTGMGDDGKGGSAWIKARGGTVFAEAEETCVVYGMPRAVAEAGLADSVIPLDAMADAILEVAHGKNHGG